MGAGTSTRSGWTTIGSRALGAKLWFGLNRVVAFSHRNGMHAGPLHVPVALCCNVLRSRHGRAWLLPSHVGCAFGVPDHRGCERLEPENDLLDVRGVSSRQFALGQTFLREPPLPVRTRAGEGR
jgi:hypothetical protein